MVVRHVARCVRFLPSFCLLQPFSVLSSRSLAGLQRRLPRLVVFLVFFLQKAVKNNLNFSAPQITSQPPTAASHDSRIRPTGGSELAIGPGHAGNASGP